jgi:hypothetical protein
LTPAEAVTVNLRARHRYDRKKVRSKNGADGKRDIEHVVIEGMELFGQSDIEGKAAMGSGE